MEKRRMMCLVITILFIASVMFGGTILKNLGKEVVPEVPKVAEKKKEKKYNTYDMYVSINPLVKLTFKAEYETCDNSFCFTGNDEIIDYELINEDAKTIYNELDFKSMKLMDVLILLCDTARESKITYDSVSITTDWMDMYDDEVLKNEIKAKSKYELDFDIFVDVKEYINDEEIIENTENEKIIEYIVSFNRDNGDSIIKRKVKENELVQEVKSGNKSGYTFVEWQLNGKKYDFNTPITKDISLVAKWKKGETTTTTTTTNIVSNDDNTPTQTTTPTTKPKSTLDKINLNDKILVGEITEKNNNHCSARGWLATNFNEVFAKYLHGNNFAIYVENEEDNFDELISRLEVDDEAKVKTLKEQLNSLKDDKNPNIVNFNYNIDNYEFSYSYQYLSSSNFSSILNNKKVSNIINNSIINWTGESCSTPKSEEKELDESLCNKYNLNCDRW